MEKYGCGGAGAAVGKLLGTPLVVVCDMDPLANVTKACIPLLAVPILSAVAVEDDNDDIEPLLLVVLAVVELFA